MDLATALVLALAVISLTTVTLSALFQRRAPTISARDNVHLNVSRAGDHSNTVAGDGAKTNIQACEDTLGYLARASENLELIQELIEAVRAGRYRGDIAATFNDLFQAIHENTLRARHTVALHRDGEYDFGMTEAELDARYRRNGGSKPQRRQ